MYKIFAKRLIDILLSLCFIPFLVVIYIVVAPVIFFYDRGPIFYNAPRLGKNGKVFMMYKFRSMKVNAPDIRNEDGSTFNSENDLRLTPIGKIIRPTSLDEIPQLLNILKGEMSIVGPRPDLPEAIQTYTDIEKKKLLVRPGITGYSQAYFRNSIQMNEKFANDNYYVNNLSFIFDLRIILRTIYIVIGRRNIYTNERVHKGK